MIIADSFNLELLSPTYNVSTRYPDSDNSSNSTIDLMFFQSGSRELNNHSIYPDLQLSLDHMPLTVLVDIILFCSSIPLRKIVKRSLVLSRTFHTLSRVLMYLTCLILIS